LTLEQNFGQSRSMIDLLSVCLLATSRKNYWCDLHEKFTGDVSVDK